MTAAPPTSPLAPDVVRTRIKSRYIAYLQSPEVKKTWGMGVPWVSFAIAGVLFLTIIGIPGAIGILIGRWIRYSIAKGRHAAVVQQAARCQPITVYPLMVNSMLLRQKGVVAPGLVVGTFRSDIGHDYFHDLAMLIADIDSSGPRNDAEKFIAGLFEDEEYQKDRRRKLPAELTGGLDVYAFDLAIDTNHLPTEKLESPIIPCMAEPGDKGVIFTIPWWTSPDPRDWLLMLGDAAAPKPEPAPVQRLVPPIFPS